MAARPNVPHVPLNTPLLPGAIDRSTEINHPSPSLDPRVIEAIEGYDDATKGYCQCALEAFATAHKAIADCIGARDALRATSTLTEDGRLVKLADYAETRQLKATKAFDSAHARLEAGIKHTESELNKPLQSTAADSIATEIRTFMRSLKVDERRALITEAIKNGDARTASAVLGTLPYLSGIDETQQSVFVRQWNELRHPEMSARLSVMKRALDLIGERGPLIFTQIEDAMGGRGAQQRVQRARALHHAAEVATKLE